MKIEIKITDQIIKNILSNIKYYISDKYTKYIHQNKIKKVKKINRIRDEWFGHYMKEYEEVFGTITINEIKKIGMYTYGIKYKNINIGELKCLFGNFFGFNINKKAISQSLLDKLNININDGIITLKVSDGRLITAMYNGSEYSQSDDTLIIYTNCGNYKFSVKRYENVITYILNILESKLHRYSDSLYIRT